MERSGGAIVSRLFKGVTMKAIRYLSVVSVTNGRAHGTARFCVDAGEVKVHFEIQKIHGDPGIGECRVLGACNGACADAGALIECEFPEQWEEFVHDHLPT